jgi:hypothetical protein
MSLESDADSNDMNIHEQIIRTIRCNGPFGF